METNIDIVQICDFLKTFLSQDNVLPESDIFNDFNCTGDDCDELMNEYSKKFNVKMDEYLWYFHHDEEGRWTNIGGYIYAPPYERVTRIPITPTILCDFANTGKWEIKYPEHKISKIRFDMLINWAIIGIIIYLMIF